MFNDLELRTAGERKVATFKEIEQVFLADCLAIDLVIFSVGLTIIHLPQSDLFGMMRNPMLGVVQSYFDPIDIGVCVLALDCAGWAATTSLSRLLSPTLLAGAGLLGDIVQHSSLLLFGHG